MFIRRKRVFCLGSAVQKIGLLLKFGSVARVPEALTPDHGSPKCLLLHPPRQHLPLQKASTKHSVGSR